MSFTLKSSGDAAGCDAAAAGASAASDCLMTSSTATTTRAARERYFMVADYTHVDAAMGSDRPWVAGGRDGGIIPGISPAAGKKRPRAGAARIRGSDRQIVVG